MCVCFCALVFLCLLYTEYQNTFSTSKARTFCGREDSLGDSHNFKGPFEDDDFVLRLGFRAEFRGRLRSRSRSRLGGLVVTVRVRRWLMHSILESPHIERSARTRARVRVCV